MKIINILLLSHSVQSQLALELILVFFSTRALSQGSGSSITRVEITYHITRHCEVQLVCKAYITSDSAEYHLVMYKSSDNEATVLSHSYLREVDGEVSLTTNKTMCGNTTTELHECAVFSAKGVFVAGDYVRLEGVNCVDCDNSSETRSGNNEQIDRSPRSIAEGPVRIGNVKGNTVYYLSGAVVLLCVIMLILFFICGCCICFKMKRAHSSRENILNPSLSYSATSSSSLTPRSFSDPQRANSPSSGRYQSLVTADMDYLSLYASCQYGSRISEASNSIDRSNSLVKQHNPFSKDSQEDSTTEEQSWETLTESTRSFY